MSLRVRLKIDAKCCLHPRYNPETDERPANKNCAGCESLYVIWLYAGIARKKAEHGDGLARHVEPRSVQPTDGCRAAAPRADTARIDDDEKQEAP